MRQEHHQWDMDSGKGRSRAGHKALSDFEAMYDGQTAELGYSEAIFDLLLEPVTLGVRGISGNRGHQR